jgi:hypothetical protein
MSLPAVSTKTNLDAASDDPAQARSELATLVDNVNALRTHLATSSLTSGTAVAAATGGLEVSGTDIRTAHTFAAKTGAYTALAADRGKVINFTTAGVTLSLTAAATLGDGWWCVVVNSAASGILTIDPNSSETIDGSTTIVLLPGQSCIVFCNGSLLRTVGRPRIAQVVNTQDGTVETGTTQIPSDNTIPQSTEGNQYMSVAITPTNANSTLIIEVVWIGSTSISGAANLIAALFQDSTASALAVSSSTSPAAGSISPISFKHKMTAGTTSETTFKVRAGASAAGTTTFNGSAGAGLFGGTYRSSITITEILP